MLFPVTRPIDAKVEARSRLPHDCERPAARPNSNALNLQVILEVLYPSCSAGNAIKLAEAFSILYRKLNEA
jgi:hypothetical protein